MSRPAGKRKLLSLELGRFLAALSIMLSHCLAYMRMEPKLHAPHFLGGLAIPQPPGVTFFFVLSGFVMMTAHGDDFGRWRAAPNFFWRRFCRIYPAYWAALVLPMVLFWSITTPLWFIKLVTLAPVPVVEYDTAAWTLRFELAFYLVFGLGLLPRIGRPLLWAWALALAVLTLSPLLGAWRPASLIRLAYGVSLNGTLSHFLSPMDVLFLVGIGAGMLWRRDIHPIPFSVTLLFVTFSCFSIAILRGGFGYGYGDGDTILLSGVGFAAVILLGATAEAGGRLRLGRLSARLGALSYPLYIIHTVIIFALSRLMQHFDITKFLLPWQVLILLLAVVLASSVALTWWFDQPVQRRLRRLMTKQRRTPQPKSPATV